MVIQAPRCVRFRLWLPDVDTVCGSKEELVGWLDGEGLVPAVDVANGLGAIVAGGVRVGEDLLAQSGIPGDGGPVLAEGEEELLIGSEAGGG